MENNDSDSGSDDLVVGLRRPQNQTDVRTQHMAFDAKAIRIVREMETMINLERADQETLKALLIVHMLQLETEEEESLGLSSLSTSYEESMTEIDDLTPGDSSYSSMSLSMSSDTSDDDDIEDYEDKLMVFSLMTNISLDILDGYCQQLFEFSVIRQSDMNLCENVRVPKMNRLFGDLTETECKNWTRFTKEQLIRMRDLFFSTDRNDTCMIKNRIYHFEEIMLISLTYQASGEKYSSMYLKFGGDWRSYTYPINHFVDHMFMKYYNLICLLLSFTRRLAKLNLDSCARRFISMRVARRCSLSLFSLATLNSLLFELLLSCSKTTEKSIFALCAS